MPQNIPSTNLCSLLAEMAEDHAAACRYDARRERSACNDPAAERSECDALMADREASYHRAAA